MRVQVWLQQHNEYTYEPMGLAKVMDIEEFGHDDEADAWVVLEELFEQLNVGGDIVPAKDYTVAYRAAGNRSLSVDDVVILNDKAWRVGRFGWEPTENQEEVAV